MPNPFGDLQELLQWTTRGQNCPICDSLRGRVYTYDTWMSSGVWPGFHNNCDCYLKKVGYETVVSDLDFFGTDLNLLSETFNSPFAFLRLHWDPNYQPFSWYITEEITQAHLTYGAGLPIGQVLKKMKDQFVGFFKRSKIFDNFFVWRVFRTVQHFQDQDGGFTGGLPPSIPKSRATLLTPLPPSKGILHFPDLNPNLILSLLLPELNLNLILSLALASKGILHFQCLMPLLSLIHLSPFGHINLTIQKEDD